MRPDPDSKPSIAWLLGLPLALLGASCLTNGLGQYTAAGAGGAGGQSSSRGAAGGDTTGTAGNGGHAQGPTGSGGSACSAMCGGGCVDLDSNPKHCGSCTNACPSSYGCTQGTCDNVPVNLVAGAQLTCAVLHGGELWCWGRDVFGEVGIPPSDATTCADESSDGCLPTPTKLEIPPVAEVGAGSEFTCARTIAGDVYCWGSNRLGRLGHDPSQDPICVKASVESPTPPGEPCSTKPHKVALPAGVTAAQLSVGVDATCIVSTASDVYCWGDNGEGVIQSPVGGSFAAPTKNTNVNQDVTEVSVSQSAEGWTTACVVRKTSRHVDCWGESVNKTLFNTGGASGCAFPPCDPGARSVPLNFTDGTGNVVADHVQPGYVAACALDGGTVSCWGNNAFGQSGDSSSEMLAHFDPRALLLLPTTIIQLSMTFATTLALDATGQVYSLGWNSIGQTGNGTMTGANCHADSGACLFLAKPDATLTNIARVSAGSFGSGAITKDGKVLVWGSNYVGEMGHAPGTDGDVDCGGGDYCHPMPRVVDGLP